jgi:hypothetical protein
LLERPFALTLAAVLQYVQTLEQSARNERKNKVECGWRC